jgi:hypothetical protein
MIRQLTERGSEFAELLIELELSERITAATAVIGVGTKTQRDTAL